MRVEPESSPSKEKKLLDRELIGESEKGEKRFFGRLIRIVSGTNGDGIRGSIGGSRYSRGGARAKGSPCPDFSSRDFSLYRYLRCFPVSCVAETRNISALWIFSSPSAFLETRPARCFVGSPIPRKTRSFRDSRIEKKKELRGNIIGPPFWNLFSFIFFIAIVTINIPLEMEIDVFW